MTKNQKKKKIDIFEDHNSIYYSSFNKIQKYIAKPKIRLCRQPEFSVRENKQDFEKANFVKLNFQIDRVNSEYHTKGRICSEGRPRMPEGQSLTPCPTLATPLPKRAKSTYIDHFWTRTYREHKNQDEHIPSYRKFIKEFFNSTHLLILTGHISIPGR